jgi:hypothetical protein
MNFMEELTVSRLLNNQRCSNGDNTALACYPSNIAAFLLLDATERIQKRASRSNEDAKIIGAILPK